MLVCCTGENALEQTHLSIQSCFVSLTFTGKTEPLPQYGSFISRIFPYHGKHLHTMELDKTMDIGFSNLFLQYFQNICILWKVQFVLIIACVNSVFRLLYSVGDVSSLALFLQTSVL